MPKRTIDRDRIIYGDNTYPVRAITSVTTSKDVSTGADGCTITLVIVGICLLGYVIVSIGLPDTKVVHGIGTIIVFIAALWGAQQVNRKETYSYYYIHLHMAGGEEAKIKNDTAEAHRKCLDAINRSLAG